MGWKCLSCNFPINRVKNTECFKCLEQKRETINQELPKKGEKSERKNMDWKCLVRLISLEFSSKTECFKCQEPKGDAIDYELSSKDEEVKLKKEREAKSE